MSNIHLISLGILNIDISLSDLRENVCFELFLVASCCSQHTKNVHILLPIKDLSILSPKYHIDISSILFYTVM